MKIYSTVFFLPEMRTVCVYIFTYIGYTAVIKLGGGGGGEEEH